VLGGLMVAGADVDARMFLLPDVVTWGTASCGVLASAALDQTNPWLAGATAFGRAIAPLSFLPRCDAVMPSSESPIGDRETGAADKAESLTGCKSLYRQLPVFGRLAYPGRAEVTKHDMPGRKSPGCPAAVSQR
jgi:hypothetical protein